MLEDFEHLTDEDYEVNELGTSEDEEDLDEEYEEIDGEYVVKPKKKFDDSPGVTEIYESEDEEFKTFYEGFPDINDIYKEGYNLEETPENYDQRQEALFRQGVQEIKKINEKYKCHLSFRELVDYFDKRYEAYQKQLPINSSMFNCMSYELWREATIYAKKMEQYKSFSKMSVNSINKDLKQNFKEISKVIRLYAKIHPEKFPINEHVTDVTNNTYVFNSKGKLRSTFKINSTTSFNTRDTALYLHGTYDDMYKVNFFESKYLFHTKERILNNVIGIINGKGQAPVTQGEKVNRLAECVMFLRPLQSKREHRNLWDFIKNRKAYIAERDTLRQCKEYMQNLGLSRKEISKVLHGGDFNSVRFNDGMTVYDKRLNPDVIDSTQIEQLTYVSRKVIVLNEPEVEQTEAQVNRVHSVSQNLQQENIEIEGVEPKLVSVDEHKNKLYVYEAEEPQDAVTLEIKDEEKDVKILEDYFPEK